MEGPYLIVYTWTTTADLNRVKMSLQITTKVSAENDFMCIFLILWDI